MSGDRGAPEDGDRAPGAPEPERRRALRLLGGALGLAAVGGLAATTGCGPPTLDAAAVTRLPLDEVPPGRRIKVPHGGLTIEVLRTGATVTARVMVCTHQFCEVIWVEWEGGYHCPCHAGKFDADGRPRGGPVTEPLTEVPARVVDDAVVIGPAASA